MGFGGFSPSRFWDLYDLWSMFIYTKLNALVYALVYFIDIYIYYNITELSATNGLVFSRQDNSDMLKLLQFEL